MPIADLENHNWHLKKFNDMGQNYNSSTNLQNTSMPPVLSFSINTFWHHVTMSGKVGVDQHGNEWHLNNGKLYAKDSYHIVSLQKCMR